MRVTDEGMTVPDPAARPLVVGDRVEGPRRLRGVAGRRGSPASPRRAERPPLRSTHEPRNRAPPRRRQQRRPDPHLRQRVLDRHLVRRPRPGLQRRGLPLRRGPGRDPPRRRARRARSSSTPRTSASGTRCGTRRRPGGPHPLLEAAIAYMKVPRDLRARGDDPLRGAGGRGHGHLGRGHGGPRRRSRRPHPRAASRPHEVGRRRPARRDRDARPAVRHPGPARLRLRRDQLHRDVRLPARLGVARPGAEPGLVGARAAPPSRLPRQVARLLGPPRGGHPLAGERRAGLPRHRRPAPHRAPLAGRALRGRLRRASAGP